MASLSVEEKARLIEARAQLHPLAQLAYAFFDGVAEVLDRGFYTLVFAGMVIVAVIIIIVIS